MTLRNDAPIQCQKLSWHECLDIYGELTYIPTLWGNCLFLGIFCAGMIAQLYLGIRHRTWGFLIAMACGIALEIMGYVARIELHDDIFSQTDFIIYLIGLTIGPAFFSAGLYFSISRILSTYGNNLSFLRPRTITMTFIGCDILSLILQAVGGAIAASAAIGTQSWTGINIMIAGLSTQVVSTTAFGVVCLHLIYAVRRHPEKVNVDTYAFRHRTYFRLFLLAIAIATVCILVRCCFRVAELQEGFTSSLANNQVLFMVLDGVMMIFTVFVLSVAHPGSVFGYRWHQGAFRWRRNNEKEMLSTSTSNAPADTTAE